MIEEFERHLRGTNLSENTVTSFLFAVRQFEERHDAVTKRNLKEDKYSHALLQIRDSYPKMIIDRTKHPQYSYQLLPRKHRKGFMELIIHQGAAESLPRKCH